MASVIAARRSAYWRTKRGLRLAEGEAEQVVRDEYLRVAVGARADADGRDVERRRHLARDLARDDFEDDGEDARLFERQRVLDERARGVGRLRLKR